MSYPAFEGRLSPYGSIAPSGDIVPIDPHDDNDLADPVRALYIETGGAIAFITASGATRAIEVDDFSILPVGVLRVLDTGTTATGIHGFVK